jgi:urease accessory protein UreH
VDRILGRLASVFVERRTLSIGVAQRQLVIEGVATDPTHPVLSDLARRLHDHRLAAVVFREGAAAAEVEQLLETLSQETERGAEPVGLRAPEAVPTWPHLQLRPVG